MILVAFLLFSEGNGFPCYPLWLHSGEIPGNFGQIPGLFGHPGRLCLNLAPFLALKSRSLVTDFGGMVQDVASMESILCVLYCFL